MFLYFLSSIFFIIYKFIYYKVNVYQICNRRRVNSGVTTATIIHWNRISFPTLVKAFSLIVDDCVRIRWQGTASISLFSAYGCFHRRDWRSRQTYVMLRAGGAVNTCVRYSKRTCISPSVTESWCSARFLCAYTLLSTLEKGRQVTRNGKESIHCVTAFANTFE